MANLKTPKQFIEFLKEKGVYRQFKEAVKNNNCCGDETDLDKFLADAYDNEAMADLINDGFLWEDTDPQEQGFHFWNALDTEWHNRYYEDYK